MRTQQMTIGGRLAQIRGAMSQRSFAEEVGIPLSTYQTYEQGRREPDLRLLTAIFARGWNLNWLLTGDGPERLENKPQGSSQLLRLHRNTFRSAIETVESALELVGGPFSAGDRAELIEVTYRHLVKKRLAIKAQALRTIQEAIDTSANSG